ncbi:hypothetical protein FIBSPDRAFT_1046288 [Athelia psychrophila]|uniref:Uncharacterized protein n=1 Tax=Athelia psychrophila TaxID=1759441 RepID=A0A166GWH1_9AGAM|nr:hypothetical protein FIBSPDRAFT_1046288 [Fibularhizoctonia sp. CBS 109695]
MSEDSKDVGSISEEPESTEEEASAGPRDATKSAPDVLVTAQWDSPTMLHEVYHLPRPVHLNLQVMTTMFLPTHSKLLRQTLSPSKWFRSFSRSTGNDMAAHFVSLDTGYTPPTELIDAQAPANRYTQPIYRQPRKSQNRTRNDLRRS